ncbi:hypothetical protein B005_1242 [Nocardiopsis alba ATCC BAA-2165]|uniref:Uncharacterized protein n=1 Tax=Nocardiopsis alba (strain ATCC BAA-2165 / BE74) TaxID=1205910 RepID=J7L7C6_NOCAA|nr:hypothetical protein B005_1242 [Nocardiopsis alba ATCC BAA-2165]
MTVSSPTASEEDPFRPERDHKRPMATKGHVKTGVPPGEGPLSSLRSMDGGHFCDL